MAQAKKSPIAASERKSSLTPAKPNPQSRNTVTVACKLMHGIVLRLFRTEEYREQGRDGNFYDSKRAVEIDGARITIKGMSSLLRFPDPKMPAVFEYALTPGVPADIWEAWLRENLDSDIVRNGLIFAQANDADANAKARELEKVRTGFEGIDQANPGFHVKGVQQGVSA